MGDRSIKTNREFDRARKRQENKSLKQKQKHRNYPSTDDNKKYDPRDYSWIQEEDEA